MLKTSEWGTLHLPSDVCVRSFLCPFYTLIKHCYTKALERSSLVPGPKAKSSSSEITNLTLFTISYHWQSMGSQKSQTQLSDSTTTNQKKKKKTTDQPRLKDVLSTPGQHSSGLWRSKPGNCHRPETEELWQVMRESGWKVFRSSVLPLQLFCESYPKQKSIIKLKNNSEKGCLYLVEISV